MLTRYDFLPICVDQAIRQAAILSAFPPVGASSAQGGAQVTLAAITYAQRPMHEDLQRHGRSLGDLPYLVQ